MFLFPSSIGLVQVSEHWFLSRDGDSEAKALFDRHYSRRHYRDGREPKIFVGPGEKQVLVNEDCSALFVWRNFICDVVPKQEGVNCAVFRNESGVLSSTLIKEACAVAWTRWPDQRLWTLVDSRRIRSSNPGYCFIKAGWSRICLSKTGKIILAINPRVDY